MPVELARVEEIFAEAVMKGDATARAAYLDGACGDDWELRRRVEQLLAAHDATGNFLKLPDADGATSPFVPVSEGPKSKIGRYKLLEQIGEGGFGVVFMAEQEEPVRRRVALKIIKLGMDTRQIVARFEAERQALAMMDHPSVAKVLDGGATETGRPYFVMELVKGVPITEYCDQHNLSIPKRLELFAQVCQAVQHAHQKGLIHRDIKPSNVLVSTQDDRPMAKVIDFGVAKAMQARLTEKTLFTEFQQLVGTPAYMSPEQAAGSLDIDTRSDVYALGVLLYELLAGTPPFDPKELRSKAFAEMQRIIREVEPPTPSMRLSSLSRSGEPSRTISEQGSARQAEPTRLASIAAHRAVEPRKLAAMVRGELDWIVMKSLEKDRARRYETASGLARDIERYLADEPVQACPPSAAYRFRKFARRNKAALAVASAAIAMLLMLVTGLAISNRLIAAQRAQADAERQRAEENLLRARVAVRDILFEAALGRGEWVQLPKPLREKFAEKTTDFYHSLLREESSSPSLQYETAVGYRSLAALHDSLREFEHGEKFARQAVSILDRLATDHPDAIEYRHQQAYGYYILGGKLRHLKREAEAEVALQHAATLYEKLISQRPDVADYFNELPLCYSVLAQLQKGRGASQDLKQTIQRLVKLASKAPAGTANPGDIQSNIALALKNAGALDDAIATYQELLRLNPQNAAAHSALGSLLIGKERWDEAIDAYRKVIQLKPDDANAYANLAYILNQQDNGEEAEAAARKEIELAPSSDAYGRFGNALTEEGKLDEAAAAYRKGIELNPNAPVHYNNLGIVLAAQGKTDEAAVAYGKAIELDPQYVHPHTNLGNLLSNRGQLDEAIAAHRKAIEIDPNYVPPYWNLGNVLAKQGKLDQAVVAYRKAIELEPNIASQTDKASDWFFLAMAHSQLGHKGEARTWYDKAVEWMDKNQPKNEELVRLRIEAAELLGIAEPQPATEPAPQP